MHNKGNAGTAATVPGAVGVSRVSSADDAQHSGLTPVEQRQIERLHAAGSRPIGELIAEVLERLDADEAERLRERLARYAAIPPHAYAAVGADTFAAAPIHSTDGGA